MTFLVLYQQAVQLLRLFSNAINVTDVGEDLTIDSTGQYTDAQQDINTVSDTTVDSQIQNKVMEAIKQATKTEGGLSLPGTATYAKTENDVKTLIGTHVKVDNIIKNTNTQTLSNVLNVNKIRGNVKISNFNQTVKGKNVCYWICKTMQTLGVTIDTSRSIDQSATSDAMPIDNIIDSVGNAISKSTIQCSWYGNTSSYWMLRCRASSILEI